MHHLFWGSAWCFYLCLLLNHSKVLSTLDFKVDFSSCYASLSFCDDWTDRLPVFIHLRYACLSKLRILRTDWPWLARLNLPLQLSKVPVLVSTSPSIPEFSFTSTIDSAYFGRGIQDHSSFYLVLLISWVHANLEYLDTGLQFWVPIYSPSSQHAQASLFASLTAMIS